jgi:hypothetical protein
MNMPDEAQRKQYAMALAEELAQFERPMPAMDEYDLLLTPGGVFFELFADLTKSGCVRPGDFAELLPDGNRAYSMRSSLHSSPSGQARPAAFMRVRYSWTVLWLVWILRAIWRWPSFCSKCRRRISLIFLMDFRFPGKLRSALLSGRS